MTRKEQAAINTLKGMKVERLLNLWQETEKTEMNLETARVREWLMTALETKSPAAFEAWMLDEQDRGPEAHFTH